MTKRKTKRTGAKAPKPKPVNLLDLLDDLPEQLPSPYQPQYLTPDPREFWPYPRTDGRR